MERPLSRYESVIEQQIRMAQERGDFDDLPGMGKPLPGKGRPDDDLWWVREYMRREELSADALLPPSIQLAKEIERLPETVGRLPSEQMVREAVSELNRRIVAHLRAPSGPPVPVRPVNADDAVAQWREAWQTSGRRPTARATTAAPAIPATPATSAGPGGSPDAGQEPPRRPGWRRWLGRRRRTRA